MRFLRMLTNSVIVGALAAAFLTTLVLQLNPDVPMTSTAALRWFMTLGLLYGLPIAVGSYLLIVARAFFAMEAMSPGWVSVRVLAWLAALLSAAVAVLMWLNVFGFEQALGPESARRMMAGAAAMSASALVLFAIAVLHYSFGRRGSRVGASLFVLAIVASLALPLVARGAARAVAGQAAKWSSSETSGTSDGPRVTLIALDGASLGYIILSAAEGRLPNFSRVLEGGAALDLATVRPTQPDPVWTAVATGMYPGKNGIRSAARYFAGRDRREVDLLPDHCLAHALVRVGLVSNVPRTSHQWTARPLWGILSDAGVSNGIIRWPLTHPAQPILGFVVSNRFHRGKGASGESTRAIHPPELVRSLSSLPADPISGGAGFLPGSPEAEVHERDLVYARATRALAAERQPRFLAVRYEGIDVVGHHYLQYTQQPGPSDVPEPVRRQFAQVIDRYYSFIDGELGVALEAMRPGDLLLVVSGFGMHRTSPVKRALARLLREPDLSGTHERAPDGFLLAFGSAVQHGRPQRGSIVDVTPTLLYFFGLPVALDMDGFARSDLFTREFTTERPITFIPSYR